MFTKAKSILQLTKYYPPNLGGMEKVAKDISRVLVSAGYEVNVFSCSLSRSSSCEKAESGEFVKRIGVLSVLFRMPISFRYVWESIKGSFKSDLIIVHHPFPLSYVPLLFVRKPYVVWYHADVQSQFWVEVLIWPLVWLTMYRAKKVIVSSEGLKKHGRFTRFFLSKVEVVPFGAKSNLATNYLTRPKKEVLKLLSVGRLVSYKGLEVAIRSLADLKHFKWEYNIVGQGPLFHELGYLIKELGLQTRVRLMGHQDNLIPFFKEADVFLFPSITEAEAFGVVKIEAMSWGLPVINTKLKSGVPEVSLHKVTGLTVEPKSVYDLRKAILQLLNNEQDRYLYGKNAYDRFLKEYSFDRFLNRFLDVLNDVLK